MPLFNEVTFIYDFLIFMNGGSSMTEIIKEFLDVVTAVGIFPIDGYCGD